MSEKVVLRPFENGDLDAVIEMTTRVLSSKRSHEDARKIWNWQFDNNPYASKDIPYAWVLDHDGKIVGSTGQVAFPMKVGSETVIAYANSAFAVKEEYRTYGVTLASKFWRNGEIPFLVATTANEVASRVDQAFGAQELAMGKNSWIRVGRLGNLVQEFLDRQNGRLLRMVRRSRLPSFVLAFVNILCDIANELSFVKLFEKKIQVERITEFGSEFDELWSEVSAHYDALSVRDSKYLNWRYVDYPLEKPYVFAAYDSDTLRGFAAIAVRPSGGVISALILELFTRPGDRPIQQALLRTALKCAFRHKADVVTSRTFPAEIGRFLKKNLFLAKKTSYSSYLFKDNASVLSDLPGNEDQWFVSPGDPDASF